MKQYDQRFERDIFKLTRVKIMKFRIDTNRIWYSKEKVEQLTYLGFEFVLNEYKCFPYKKIYNKNLYIEIESIEQLVDLGNKIDCDLIIDSKNMIIYIDDE